MGAGPVRVGGGKRMIAFLFGLFGGMTIGVFIAALCRAGRDD